MDSLSLFNAVEVIVGGAAGGTAAVTFLSRYLGEAWLGRVLEKEKAKYTREIENLKAGFAKDLEHYRAQLDRSIFVTRTHFETEFDAYKAVFEKLAEMRIQFGGLRPSMSLVPANDTKEARRERLSRAVEKAQETYNQLITTSENLSPFYPSEIYQQIVKCQHAAKTEINDILSSPDEFTLQWFGRGNENLREFMAGYKDVSTLIRDRISKLAFARSAEPLTY